MISNYILSRNGVIVMKSTTISEVKYLKKATASAFLFWKAVYVDTASVNLNTVQVYVISVSSDFFP